jgi:uncharacterized phage infection (PIP) family protein YhgE
MDDLPEQIEDLKNELKSSLKKVKEENRETTQANSQEILEEMKNLKQVATKEDIDKLREDLKRVSKTLGSQEQHEIAQIDDQLSKHESNLTKELEKISNFPREEMKKQKGKEES